MYNSHFLRILLSGKWIDNKELVKIDTLQKLKYSKCSYLPLDHSTWKERSTRTFEILTFSVTTRLFEVLCIRAMYYIYNVLKIWRSFIDRFVFQFCDYLETMILFLSSILPVCLLVCIFFWNIYWTIIMYQNIRIVLGDWLVGEDGDFENKWNSVCVLEDLYSL